jgi:hypothetical protein
MAALMLHNSHMLLNMRFPKGFNFFSVRNENDNSYGRGIEIEKGIYDIKAAFKSDSSQKTRYEI